ncbi:ribosomal RNA processing protein 1 homolog A-like [Palaemon carinicauda]|uniref:ribosomal RNA processing protein 1 homolog A-like n=1 Tax=Palaemon carinicauda TaxID=392227 RepID=UPI0035B65FCF
MSSGTSSLPNVRGSMQEVLFAQRLADNEKKVRDRALRKLKVFLNLKSSSGPGLTDDDALKIWKGLFYCMYMADKPLVQEDVAEEISYLIHDLVNPKDRYTFTSAAFRTFAREWNGIDVFRMDKFMMFLRRVLRQVFVHLKLQQWTVKEVVRYMNILDADVIRADDHTNVTPLGIKLHLCGIIMEELAKIGGEELDNKVILAVIKPFLKVLGVSKLDVYRNAVAEDIIRHLMRQTDLGVEEEDDIEGILKGKLRKKDKMSMVYENAVDEDEVITADGEDDDDDVEMEERTLEDAVLDPRAGSVSVFIPQLKPDFELIANALQNVGSLKNVSKTNRQLLYKLVAECKDMAGQVYPLALPEELLYDDDDDEEDEEEEEKAVERLQEFYTKLREVPSTDVKKMEDLKVDPLKNLSIEKSLSDRKPRKKKSKLKRLKKKKAIPLSKKLALSKQEAAAEVNRLKAVELKLGQIAQEVGVPTITNMPMKKKSTEMPSNTTKSLKRKKKSSEANMAKVPKKKKSKSSGFEVSAITPDSGEVKSKFSSSSGYEVTPIGNKDESGHEQKNIPKSGEISEKMQGVGQPEVLVSDLPKKTKSKKKKVKADAHSGHLLDVSQLVTSDSLEKVKESKRPVSVCTETGGQNGVKESQENECGKAVAVKEKSEKIEGVFSLGASKSGTQSPKKSGKAKNKHSKVNINLENNKLTMITKKPKKENLKEIENLNVSSPVNAANTATFANSPKKTPSKGKGLTMNFSGDENLSFGKRSVKEDIEIFIKNRRQMKLEKRKSANSPIFQVNAENDRKLSSSLRTVMNNQIRKSK